LTDAPQVQPPQVVPIVLAAGASTRMGGKPKAALPFGDTTALGLVLDALREAGLPPALVVAGAHPDEVRQAIGRRQATLVKNPRWAEGRATSLQAGLAALPPGTEAFLLWPVDVPLPGADVVTALLAARAKSPDKLAWVPSHEDRRGHPALFSTKTAELFQKLKPDGPARDVVRTLASRDQLEHVVVADATVLEDMDTPEEHTKLVEAWKARGGV